MSNEATGQVEEKPEGEDQVVAPAKRNNDDEENLGIPSGKKYF